MLDQEGREARARTSIDHGEEALDDLRALQTKDVRCIAAVGPGAAFRAVGLSKESCTMATRTGRLRSRQDAKTHALLGDGSNHLVSGVQTMLMPYIGLQFGP